MSRLEVLKVTVHYLLVVEILFWLDSTVLFLVENRIKLVKGLLNDFGVFEANFAEMSGSLSQIVVVEVHFSTQSLLHVVC